MWSIVPGSEIPNDPLGSKLLCAERLAGCFGGVRGRGDEEVSEAVREGIVGECKLFGWHDLRFNLCDPA